MVVKCAANMLCIYCGTKCGKSNISGISPTCTLLLCMWMFVREQLVDCPVRSGGACKDVSVSTAVFILPLLGPAIVILYRLSICNVNNAHMLQNGDEIIF